MERPWSENENWKCLKRFLPDGWEEMAQPLGVWRRRPRSIASTETLLRLLLIHLAVGCSLRETVVRAREGGLATITDVAMMKRLLSSGEWLRWMAVQLLQRRGVSSDPPSWLNGYNVRTVDATVICEPGSTGTDWRVHYSLRLFGLQCDEFHLTGPKVGESLLRFHVSPGDIILGDRAYGHVKGFRYVLNHGGHFLTRLRNKAFGLRDADGKDWSLTELLAPLDIGEIGHWLVFSNVKDQSDIPLRICAIRMSEEAADRAIRRAKKEQCKKQRKPDPETLALHRYVVLATSLPETVSARQVLDLYRARWQIELAFKRMKSIMGLGHLPKGKETSAKAWIHGKLLVAFLAEALIDDGRHFSPWGYPI